MTNKVQLQAAYKLPTFQTEMKEMMETALKQEAL
jgi:hypothetical protein